MNKMTLQKLKKAKEHLKQKPTCSFIDDEGHGFRSYIIPKNKRYKGQDGIELQWSFPDKNKGYWQCVTLKDWEALAIIDVLTLTLLKKKGIL